MAVAVLIGPAITVICACSGSRRAGTALPMAPSLDTQVADARLYRMVVWAGKLAVQWSGDG